MSIASELNNLEGNIEDSYDAVNDMGGIIPQHKNMDNLDQAIRTIPQGSSYTAGSGIDITGSTISVDNTTVPFFSDLASVATSGDYGDLLNTPTIPTKTSDLTNDGSDGTSTYVEADGLATVATTGDYDDLINTPTIPTVNDATLTITQNGTSAGTFTANASSNTTIALTDTTYSDFGGATSSVAGSAGLVPAPAAGDEGKVLQGDGTWVAQTAAQVNSDWNAASGVAQILNKPSLATVATSGDYGDLLNKPTIPAAQVNSDWDAASGVAQILNKPSLAAVATSGAYSDLTGTPTIPAAQVQSDWSQTTTTAVDYIKNKPTIPTVNNATLTIQKNGTSVGTFTANASSNATANITVPSKTQLASGGTASTTTTTLSSAATNFDYLYIDVVTNDNAVNTIVVPGSSTSFSAVGVGFASGIYPKWSGWTISGTKITRSFSCESSGYGAVSSGSYHGVKRVVGIKIP